MRIARRGAGPDRHLACLLVARNPQKAPVSRSHSGWCRHSSNQNTRHNGHKRAQILCEGKRVANIAQRQATTSHQLLARETPSRLYEFAEGLNVGKDVVRARNGAVQRYLAPVDPGDGQSERLTADEIGELRLSGMQDVFL